MLCAWWSCSVLVYFQRGSSPSLSLREKSTLKRRVNKEHNSNFRAGYVHINEEYLHKTGIRGRKTYFVFGVTIIMTLIAVINLFVSNQLQQNCCQIGLFYFKMWVCGADWGINWSLTILMTCPFIALSSSLYSSNIVVHYNWVIIYCGPPTTTFENKDPVLSLFLKSTNPKVIMFTCNWISFKTILTSILRCIYPTLQNYFSLVILCELKGSVYI